MMITKCMRFLVLGPGPCDVLYSYHKRKAIQKFHMYSLSDLATCEMTCSYIGEGTEMGDEEKVQNQTNLINLNNPCFAQVRKVGGKRGRLLSARTCVII